MQKALRNSNSLCVSIVSLDGDAWHIQHSNDGGFTFFSGERFRDENLLKSRMAEILPIGEWKTL